MRVRTYKVYSKETGELLAEGTAKECAKAVGLTKAGFRDASNAPRHRRLRIVETTEDETPVSRHGTDTAAIMSWDAFTAPLREKFGIPVYSPKREDKKDEP